MMHFPKPKGGAATGNEISGSSLKRKVEAMAQSNAQQLLTEVDVGYMYFDITVVKNMYIYMFIIYIYV